MNKYFLAGILIIIVIVTLFGCCAAKNTISGTVYVAGNDPHNYLSFTSGIEDTYRIECSEDLKNELWNLQGKKVILHIDEIKEFEKFKVAVVKGYKLEVSNE